MPESHAARERGQEMREECLGIRGVVIAVHENVLMCGPEESVSGSRRYKDRDWQLYLRYSSNQPRFQSQEHAEPSGHPSAISQSLNELKERSR